MVRGDEGKKAGQERAEEEGRADAKPPKAEMSKKAAREAGPQGRKSNAKRD